MDKKSILIGALVGALGASLLFVTIGATYYEQEPKGVWELHLPSNPSITYSINTETGEVISHQLRQERTSSTYNKMISLSSKSR